MTEFESSEENLDEFMIKASKILSKENHPETSLIINSLKEHLSSIFKDKLEMENFFKTLNSIIFSKEDSNSNNIINSQAFKLYPLVFSFNPKTSYYYVDYFLTSLQKSISSENNNNEHSFLSSIFSEVINAFYSDENSNKFLIKNNMVLEPNKKSKLYEKIFNFCNNNIKTNEAMKQSFGCLLLTEFVEKCPLITEGKNLEKLFNTIEEYLDDHWFECKLDLLNLTQSLIHTLGKKFKPYANVCLFKILDFFTDEDWMKRKLAINIVYTLVFYCKEEILSVKDNIIEFLTVLKDDPVDKVKEACIQTLNFIDECDPENEKGDNDLNNINNIDNGTNILNDNDIDNKNINDIEKKENKPNETLDKKEKDNTNINLNDININEINEIEEKKVSDNTISMDNNKKEEKSNSMKMFQIKLKNKELKEKYGDSLNIIYTQMKKIQETQNLLNNSLENIRYTIDKNYSSLNSRLKILENELEKRNDNHNNIYS